MKTEKTGWIGLGHMGTPMALNLLKAGFDLRVYNRSADKLKIFEEKSVHISSSIEEVCNNCITIFLMVSDDNAVENIFQEIFSTNITGKLFINMSTVSPDTSKSIYRQCKQKSASYLEAPVSGSVKPATEGSLIILAAGDETDYEKAIPFFEKLGKLSLFLGETGKGANAKLSINYYLASTIQAIAETCLFAESKGIGRETMMLIVNESACSSAMSQMKTPAVIKNEYPAAFPLKHMAKDVRLVKEQGLNTAMAQSIYEAFQRALTQGLGDEDVMSVIKSVQ